MGTIAQKLEYLNDTRLLLKDNINKINNVLTDNSTFRSYPQELFNGYLDVLNNGTDTLWSNLEKVSASGEEATLENVETAPIKMVLNGNTSQDTTSGNNLLDTNNISHTSTSTNLTINSNENGEITINGEAYSANVTLKSSLSTPLSGTYTLIFKKISGNISNNEINFRYAIGNAGNGSAASTTGRLLTNIFNADSNIVVSTGNINDTMEKLHIYFNAGATFNNYKFVIYLVQGTYTSENIPDYEPFTGGQPSPNPDYPQEVKVVTGENVVGVSGKNLFDKDNANITDNKWLADGGNTVDNGDWFITDYIEVSSNTTYTVSGQTVSGTNPSFCFYDENKQVISGIKHLNAVTKTYITPNNCKYIRDSVNKANLDTYMIELGSTATPYVPYSKTDYPINLGDIELCKINTYKDYFHKANGKWYVHKAIGKVVLDGTENWSATGTQTTGYSRFASSILEGAILPPSSNDDAVLAYCNVFEAISGNNTYRRHNGIDCRTSGRYIDVYYDQLAEGTAEDFKTWLSNNNVTLYYVLATPTEEEITNSTLIEQLEAISNAKSVKDKTYITQTNEELPFILDVEAIKEYEVN